MGGTDNNKETVTAGPSGNEAAAPPAISVRKIVKWIGRRQVLGDLSFEIAEGEMLVLLGPSGSGKTTLLRIIAGLEHPDAGEVYLKGHYSNHLLPQQRKLGVVFQEYALFPRMTVEQNIAFGLRIRRRQSATIKRKVDHLLDVIRLNECRRKYPSQLSGGERQRVALARALSYDPEALLFDEPFSALDPLTRTELRRHIRALLRKMKIPVLFITHDQEEALELADRIALLQGGRLEQVGTPFEVYNHPRTEFVASFLGAANVLLGRWRAGEVRLGALRLRAPREAPAFAERQAVKVVFRPEDVAINFQAQLLDTPYYLGRAIVEDISYLGPAERMAVRLLLWPSQPTVTSLTDRKSQLAVVDETFVEDFPLTITRTKWEAHEMELSAGDQVVIGLKDYRLLPHYPLGSETGAKAP